MTTHIKQLRDMRLGTLCGVKFDRGTMSLAHETSPLCSDCGDCVSIWETSEMCEIAERQKKLEAVHKYAEHIRVAEQIPEVDHVGIRPRVPVLLGSEWENFLEIYKVNVMEHDTHDPGFDEWEDSPSQRAIPYLEVTDLLRGRGVLVKDPT